jgi:DNA repair exonuclease SbcCD nuclease subunit
MSTKKELLLLCKSLGINVSPFKSKTKDYIKNYIKEYSLAKGVKVINQGNNVKTIYHTADIHIRTLERHTEYSIVFSNLYEALKDKEDSLLVVCGDIFHNKDKLVSETIILFNEFLTKLSEIIPVIMILGNHDTYSHANRLDIITGIMSVKNNTNSKHKIYFLKDSGVYKYNNINFHVSSLLDNKFIRCNDLEGINICLYHGPVYGAKLDNGMEYKDCSIKLSDFNKFDYTLLGDIHKRQFLKENIAYPGSLIQQNHKEEIEHGIIEWDLINKTNKFIKIHNDYSFVSIFLDDSDLLVNGMPLKEYSFTKKSYVKLYHTYMSEFDSEAIKKQISEHTEIASFNKEICIPKNIKTKLFVDSTAKDLDIFYQCASEFPEESKSLNDLHMSFINKFDTANDKSITTWSLVDLTFTNMFIYGKDCVNYINFTEKQGVLGVLGENAIGKSAIFNILLYALFGNASKSRSFTNRNVINKKSSHYSVSLKIQTSNSVEYIIERKGKNKRRKDNFSMEETLNFYKTENGITINLTDTNKTETSNVISKTLNLVSKETFMLTNVLSYTNYQSMLNMTSSEMSSKFIELFDLSKYQDIYSLLLKDIKKIQLDIKILETTKTNTQQLIKKTPEPKEDTELHVKIKHLKEEIQHVSKKLFEINANNKFSQEYTPEDLIKQEKIVNDINHGINHNIKDIQNENLYEMQAMLKHIKLTGIPCIETTETLYELNNQYNKLEKSKKNIIHTKEPNNQEETFDVNIFIDEMTECERHETTVSLPVDLYEDLIDLLKSVNSPKFLENTIQNIKYKEYIQNTEYNNELQGKLNRIDAKIEYVNKQNRTKLKQQIKDIQDIEKLNDIKNYFETIEMYNKKKEYSAQLTQLNKDLDTLRNEETQLKIQNCSVIFQQKQNEINQSKLEKINKELVELKTKEKLHVIYKGIINEKKLPKMILNNTLKLIEQQTNNMIYSLTGLYIEFDDESWEIIAKKNGIIHGIEHVSGYERFVINVCLKIALDKYKYFDKASFFIIDECCDTISDENISNKMNDLLQLLRNEYSNILIISHNDNLKKMVDHKIDIVTDGVNSKIKN